MHVTDVDEPSSGDLPKLAAMKQRKDTCVLFVSRRVCLLPTDFCSAQRRRADKADTDDAPPATPGTGVALAGVDSAGFASGDDELLSPMTRRRRKAEPKRRPALALFSLDGV